MDIYTGPMSQHGTIYQCYTVPTDAQLLFATRVSTDRYIDPVDYISHIDCIFIIENII